MADKIMKTLNGYEVYDEYARNKVSELREEFSQLSSDEKIAEAVNAYMEANPVEGNVTVDTDLSETSTNPVQNKVVTAKFSQLSDTIEGIKQNGTGTGTGITSTLASLFISLFRKAVFTENMSGTIDKLEAELNNSSSGGSSGNEGESGDGNEDTPAVTDDITVSDGVMTIVSVGSEITVSDGVMAIA